MRAALFTQWNIAQYGWPPGYVREETPGQSCALDVGMQGLDNHLLRNIQVKTCHWSKWNTSISRLSVVLALLGLLDRTVRSVIMRILPYHQSTFKSILTERIYPFRSSTEALYPENSTCELNWRLYELCCTFRLLEVKSTPKGTTQFTPIPPPPSSLLSTNPKGDQPSLTPDAQTHTSDSHTASLVYT